MCWRPIHHCLAEAVEIKRLEGGRLQIKFLNPVDVRTTELLAELGRHLDGEQISLVGTNAILINGVKKSRRGGFSRHIKRYYPLPGTKLFLAEVQPNMGRKFSLANHGGWGLYELG